MCYSIVTSSKRALNLALFEVSDVIDHHVVLCITHYIPQTNLETIMSYY